MKRRIILCAAMFMAAMANTFACTNLIVGKNASADGSTIVSYSADSYGLFGELYHYPAATYPKGTMLKVYEWDTGKYLGEIEQARQTYNVVGNMNEYQVTIGETTFGGRPELADSTGIIDYGSLIYIGLQRSRTAREAIKIMTDLVQQYGYYSEGESFTIADPNEIWIMEMIGKGPGIRGAVWVAVRVPDDCISAHANQSRIHQFDMNDKENCMYSPDVVSFAREKGYFNGVNKDFTINQYANDDRANQGTVVYRQFEAGRSQTALMVVRSGGIDPATGNEIYIKRNGEMTFEYNHNDKIECGDMKPKIEGNVNTNLNWKGFNLYMLFKYQYGGKIYNATLASKVEGANPLKNADKRVLYDRWKEPGDHAKFRRIDDTSAPYQTTRLVFDNNLLALQSVSLSYELPRKISLLP